MDLDIFFARERLERRLDSPRHTTGTFILFAHWMTCR